MDLQGKLSQTYINTLVDTIVDKMVDEQPVNPLITPTQEKARKKAELKELLKLDQFKAKLDHGSSIILSKLRIDLEPKDYGAVQENLKEALINSKKDNLKIDENSVMQEVLGISDETMKHYYHIGFKLFEEKNFENASAVFLFIASLNPFIYDYWNAYATSEMYLKHWEIAIKTYELLVELDPEKSQPHLLCAQCHLFLKDKINASAEIEKARDLLSNTEADQISLLKHLEEQLAS